MCIKHDVVKDHALVRTWSVAQASRHDGSPSDQTFCVGVNRTPGKLLKAIVGTACLNFDRTN